MGATGHRIWQWVGIIAILCLFAGAYWYFQVFAGVKTNTSLTDPLSEGLAGYWKLDEGSGTSVSDSSTNANTGTLTNGPTWTTGQIGSAVSFDGTNDYVDLGSSAAYNIAPGDKVSTAFWYYSNQGNGSTGTVYRRSSGSCDIFAMSITGGASTDTLGFYYRDTSCGGIDNSQVTGITKNAWHHVVSTYNTVSGVFTVYVDGAQRATSTTIPSANISISGTFQLGTSGGSNYFNGYLDELRLYRYALSADEVSQLYRLNAPTGVDTSLKGYWTFDGADISGTTATDRSGAGNTGTLTNGPTVTQGKVGQALSFDGTDDSVDTVSTTAFNSATITVSAWVRPDVGNTLNTAVARDNNNTLRNWNLGNGATANTFRFAVFISNTQYNAESAAGFSTGVWHHLVGTYDGMSVKLYVDGVNTATTAQAGSLDTDAVRVTIGTRDNVTAPWDGLIDEVRIYNTALTATQIQAQYKAGQSDEVNTGASQAQGGSRLDSGLAGYWKMDDGSGTSASDASTNANTGTLTNGPTWGTGQIGGAVDFDGNDDYVYVPYSSALISSQNLTYALWVRPDLNEFKGLLGSLNGEEGSAFNYLSIDNSGAEAGNPSIVMTRNIGGSTTTRAVQFAYTVSTWLHYTYTYNGSVERVYINGVRVGEWSQTGNFATNTENGILLGKVNTLSSSLDGLLDEVRVYTRALPEDEVVQLYRLNAPTGTDTGLKGYWSFNGKDVSGTTAYDRSGAGNTGTLTNGPTVTQGKVGQALSFDGTDDYVDTGGASSVEPGFPFSLSLWVKFDTLTGSTIPLVSSADIGGNGQYAGMWLGTASTGYVVVALGNNAGCCDSAFRRTFVTGTGVVTTGTWYHIVATVTDVNTATIFVNGASQSVTSSGAAVSSVYPTNSRFRIGAVYDANVTADTFLDGKIDEVRLYNRALSASEIQAQYKAGQSDEVNTGASQAQGTGRLDSGLSGYWKLDDGSGTTATDASTNGNTGTLTSGPTWSTGQIGGAVDFDGTNDYIALTDSAVFDPGGTATWCLWFYNDIAQGSTGLFMQDTTSGQSFSSYKWMAAYLTSSSTVLANYVRIGGTAYSAAVSGSFVGSWYHVCSTFDKNLSSARLKIYVNGTLAGTHDAANGDIDAGNLPEIGAWTYNGNYFNGKIDEVRMYGRALSADEVSQLYRLNAPTGTDTGLKGYWSFNGKDVSGTTAYDRSGAGNNGTLTNSPAVTPGKVGQALSFDGTDDYVDAGSGASVNITGAISISVWAKTNDTKQQYFVSNRNGSTGYGFGMQGSGNSYRLRFSYYGSTDRDSSINAYVSDNNWHHYVVTNDLTNMQFYVDGALFSTHAGFSGNSSSSTLKIGDLPSVGGADFAGSLDEVRIYNRALTEAEITTLYNASK